MTLSQRLVNGRKTLSLLPVPVDNARKEAEKRKEKGEGQAAEAGEEEVEGGVSSPPFPQGQKGYV